MRNPVTVLTTLLSVEFVLYTMSLCSPQWLVQTAGASEGLFALCRVSNSLFSCTVFPAWLVALCAGVLIAFLLSIERQDHQLLQHLGWTFYICCATLLYASLVTVLLGVICSNVMRVEPAKRGVAVDLSVIAA